MATMESTILKAITTTIAFQTVFIIFFDFIFDLF